MLLDYHQVAVFRLGEPPGSSLEDEVPNGPETSLLLFHAEHEIGRPPLSLSRVELVELAKELADRRFTPYGVSHFLHHGQEPGVAGSPRAEDPDHVLGPHSRRRPPSYAVARSLCLSASSPRSRPTSPLHPAFPRSGRCAPDSYPLRTMPASRFRKALRPLTDPESAYLVTGN